MTTPTTPTVTPYADRYPLPGDDVLLGWTGPERTTLIALRRDAVQGLVPSSGFANVATLDENQTVIVTQEVRYTVLAIGLAGSENEGVLIGEFTSAEDQTTFIAGVAADWLG